MIHQQPSILMPWHSSRLTARTVEQIVHAACFAHWLGADLRLLIAPAPNMDQLMRLQERLLAQIPRRCAFSIETDGRPLAESTLASAERRRPEMVLLSIEPQFFRRTIQLADWQRTILEECEDPVLVLPATAKLGPFESIIVPMKAEPMRMDSALAYSLQMGSRARIPLDILHVSPPQTGSDASAVGQLCDEFHHEYPRRIEEMIAEASPLSSVRDRRIIRDFIHVQGDRTREIFRNIKTRKSGLLAIEWDGNFARGRSETIKAIFRACRRPVLVVKPMPEKRSRLTLGGTTIAA